MIESIPKGGQVPDHIDILRRINPIFIRNNKTINKEAFRPRLNTDGTIEKGISVDIKFLLKKQLPNDRWAKINFKTALLKAEIPNNLGYPVIKTSPKGSHAEITGDMEGLYNGDEEVILMSLAKKSAIIFDPENPDQYNL